MTVSSEVFREVMSRWASGVAVVTTRHGDEVHGMTVNSFTSLAADPPLVLICADRTTHTCELINAGGVFAVNTLREGQDELSNVFAGRYPERDADRFAGVASHTDATGAPILDDSLSYLDCRVVGAHEHATHTIFVGQVQAAGVVHPDAPPLLYYQRRYRQF